MIPPLLTPAPTRVMGIVNVTPDSFSDGGDFATTGAAVVQGRRLAAEGAAVIDVGGESTRPGAERVSEADEAARVVPVVAALAAEGVAVSVDTMRASVAAQAVEAGGRMGSDVSGGGGGPGAPPPAAARAVVPTQTTVSTSRFESNCVWYECTTNPGKPGDTPCKTVS